MSIDAKKAKMLNDMNSTAFEVKLGDELKTLYDGTGGGADTRLDALELVVGDAEAGLVKDVDDIQSAIGKFVTKALVAGDIAAGVATIDTGIDFGTWYSVIITTALGAPVVITKIEKGTAADVNKILITATGVAATDIVSVIVK